MKREDILRDYVMDDEELTFLDPDYMDDAIIGISSDNRVIYSFSKLVDVLIKQGVCEDDMAAHDYICYEILSAYIGPKQPIIMLTELWG